MAKSLPTEARRRRRSTGSLCSTPRISVSSVSPWLKRELRSTSRVLPFYFLLPVGEEGPDDAVVDESAQNPAHQRSKNKQPPLIAPWAGKCNAPETDGPCDQSWTEVTHGVYRIHS